MFPWVSRKDRDLLHDGPQATSRRLSSARKTYGSFKEQFGADYPRTLSAAHNLACSLRVAGDCFAASGPDHDTLERRLCVLGSGHPYTLGSAANLARDMREAGAFRDSADVLRGTWQKYRTVLGDEIIDTLRAAASLAISLRKTGELSEARNLSLDTYERIKRRYGPGSPDALYLACDYAATRDNSRPGNWPQKSEAPTCPVWAKATRSHWRPPATSPSACTASARMPANAGDHPVGPQ